MSDLSIGDCEWSEPHPPHLWGEEMDLGPGGTKIKMWACSGSAVDDE